MCGRFTLITPLDQLMQRFAISNRPTFEFQPRYNIAPSQQVFSVVSNGNENRGGMLRWGLIPFWAKDPSIGYKMINARSETLDEKPSFRRLLTERRCLIVADSFYEWKRENNQKKPIRIRMKSGSPYAMAGLWDHWRSPEGEDIYSCTIVTTRSNDLMHKIHHRMPVILTEETEKVWLDRSIKDVDFLKSILTPYAAEEMEAYPVSTIVNSAKNDDPRCIEPMESDTETSVDD